MSILFRNDPLARPHLKCDFDGVHLNITLIGDADRDANAIGELLKAAKKIGRSLGFQEMRVEDKVMKLITQ